MYDRLRKPKMEFTQVPNALICSPDLSCKAKAVYCYLISRPDDWKFYTVEIKNNMKESLNTIKKSVKELVDFGWIEREQIRENGKFMYTVFTLFYEVSTVDQKTVDGKTADRKTVDGFLPTTNTNLTNTDSNNTTKREKEEKKQHMHDFKIFRDNFTKTVTESFTPFEYKGNEYYFTLDGLMIDTKTNKYLTKDKAFKVWDYLYQNKEKYDYEH